jgi:hypothetical protein
MTTLAWIYIVAGLVMGTIALTGHFGMGNLRAKLTRKSLPFCIAQLVTWALFGVFFFSGVLSVMYFVTVAVIYVPMIVRIVRLPKDDHVA